MNEKIFLYLFNDASSIIFLSYLEHDSSMRQAFECYWNLFESIRLIDGWYVFVL